MKTAKLAKKYAARSGGVEDREKFTVYLGPQQAKDLRTIAEVAGQPFTKVLDDILSEALCDLAENLKAEVNEEAWSAAERRAIEAKRQRSRKTKRQAQEGGTEEDKQTI